MTENFFSIEALAPLLQIEPYVLLGALALCAWLFYRIFLNEVSDERHRNLRNHHRSLAKYFLTLSFFFGGYFLALGAAPEVPFAARVAPYLGALAFCWGILVFVRACRLWVLQYLFLQSMQEGVPLLLVNVFTLLLSIALAFWVAWKLFNLQLAPLLATSAAFSIILGLALQDTLGNLFAGISLQLEKNFEIGDWIEVTSGIQRSVGQVKEISWRSVLLVGLSDEMITLPNRFMAQAGIANFSPPGQPIIRSHVFRLPFGTPLEQVKDLLERSTAEISDVRGLPAPFAYLQETTESWLSVKLIYFIDSYGSQYSIGDKVQRKGIEVLRQNGIELARTELRLSSVDKS